MVLCLFFQKFHIFLLKGGQRVNQMFVGQFAAFPQRNGYYRRKFLGLFFSHFAKQLRLRFDNIADKFLLVEVGRCIVDLNIVGVIGTAGTGRNRVMLQKHLGHFQL